MIPEGVTVTADFCTRLKGGHVFGVEVVLDVAHDAARLAHAPLAQEHDLEVVVALAAADAAAPRERHLIFSHSSFMITQRK